MGQAAGAAVAQVALEALQKGLQEGQATQQGFMSNLSLAGGESAGPIGGPPLQSQGQLMSDQSLAGGDTSGTQLSLDSYKPGGAMPAAGGAFGETGSVAPGGSIGGLFGKQAMQGYGQSAINNALSSAGPGNRGVPQLDSGFMSAPSMFADQMPQGVQQNAFDPRVLLQAMMSRQSR